MRSLFEQSWNVMATKIDTKLDLVDSDHSEYILFFIQLFIVSSRSFYPVLIHMVRSF